ncbi:redoxin domain-containing protein [Bacillus sp. V3-13]|uniref:redoxin domain-containing protein n=1 Tax=Bacillus sp. V3-13 TaxID=2053728 RepID=UPI0021532FC8|nr:redoxin domain-containing protein [Bacillus sp. V3-13]
MDSPISVDSVHSHEAWQKSIGRVSYPLCSNFYPHGEVSGKYGVPRKNKNEPAYGASEGALFIVDKEGIIQFIDVHPMTGSQIMKSCLIFYANCKQVLLTSRKKEAVYGTVKKSDPIYTQQQTVA